MVPGLLVGWTVTALVLGTVLPSTRAFALRGAVAGPVAVPLSVCAVTDNGRPVVSAFQMAVHSVDVTAGEAGVQVAAVVDDTGGPGPAAGIVAVRVVLTGPARGDTTVLGANSVASELARGPDGRTWAGTLTLPPGIVPGAWSAALTAVDGAGVDRSLPAIALRRQGWDPDLEVRSATDWTGPEFEGVELSRTSVDTRGSRQPVSVTIRAGDPESGLGKVVVTASSSDERRVLRVPLVLIAGSPRSGTWRGSLVVPRWAGSTPWRLGVRLTDRVGQFTSLRPRDLTRAGQPSAIAVISAADLGRPRVSHVTASASRRDVRTAEGVVRVTARVVDVASGVRRVLATLLPGGADQLSVALRRVSGTRHDGIWSAEVTLAPCQRGPRPASGPGTLRVTVEAADRAGRSGVAPRRSRPALDLMFRDNRGPEPQGVSRPGPSGSFEVTFDEDLVANGLWDPLVEPVGGGAELTGTWECAGVAGPVRCDVDVLRRARFTPDRPVPPERSYRMTFNREQRLNVVDLVGNPLVGARTTADR